MLIRAVAVLAGAGLYALALPPFDLAFLGWFTLVPLLLVVRGRSVGSAFAYGLLYGCAGAWMVSGFLVQAVARYFAVGMPVAVLALSVVYVVVFAPTFGLFGAGAATLLRCGNRSAERLAIPALWVATELLRGRLMGQPWGLLGYTQHGHVGLIQVAAVTGVYGVSFLLALGSAAIASAVVALRAGRPLRSLLRLLVPPAALIGALWTGGAVLAEGGPVGGFAAHPVAIVQTNVPPAFEWTRAYAERQFLAHVRATEGLPRKPQPALIVWPENAITEYLETEPLLAAELGDLAGRHHADVLFGAPRYEDGRTYNSVRLITAAGRNGGHYDKQHLVLFAEADPLSLPAEAEASESPRRFSAGSKPGVLQSFVPLGVSICHEIIYPDLVSRAVRAGAALLVNVSNDGWLDGGSGIASRQHFAMAVFRSVETRRYLVRGAVTGVSGVVDPFGRIIDSLPPHQPGTVIASVAGRNTLTPYVRLGDAFAFGCALWAAAALAARRPTIAWHRRPAE